LRITIRQKLALLVAVPVLGAMLLSLQIVSAAREQAHRAEALGSLESLVDLSVRTTELVHRLQSERATLALSTGIEARAKDAGVKAPPEAPQVREAIYAETDRALEAQRAVLNGKNEARLPNKLRSALDEARKHLRELKGARARAEQGAPLAELFGYYETTTGPLIRSIAGLTELNDDGELLRVLNSLVALLELEERASREHALLCNVFARGEFPPGSYRELVTVISEQDLYGEVFRTAGSVEAQRLLRQAQADPSMARVRALRKRALETTEDELDQSAEQWDAAEREYLGLIAQIENKLHAESRRVAALKLERSANSVRFGLGLAASVILFSLAFAGVLARGITRRLETMRDAIRRVGIGDLDVKVEASDDELGQLGNAFNQMIVEIREGRAALDNQARMSRELELATAIQRAMLPVSPAHPDFEFAGKMRPADEVGGDFYDVLSQERALWITIGDVSGHGIGAGLVMLMVQSAFASHFLNDPAANPSRVWRQVNDLLCENVINRLKDDKYVTATLLAYRDNGRFACAGAHEWPIIYRKETGRCEVVETPGPWLGIQRMTDEIPVKEIELAHGDVLCLYSDGITETRNLAGELFDVERLIAVLSEALGAGESLSEVGERVLERAEAFSGRREDDWTLLLVRRMS
jgi:serine phosphatase RsbU (regulator of sigma subunit)